MVVSAGSADLAGDKLEGAEEEAGAVARGEQCSGLVPGRPLPPSSFGVVSLTSRMPSDERGRALPRPPVEVALRA